MAADFVQMDLLSWCSPDPVADIGIPASEPTLADLCRSCKAAHPGCDKCCSQCTDRCNGGQRCSWPGVPVDVPAAQPTTDEYRDSICGEWRFCDYQDICFTPENESAGICFRSEPLKLPESVSSQFTRDQKKLLAAGFMLVRYNREAKLIEISLPDPADGWGQLPQFATYAAAERKLKEVKEAGRIETDLTGRIVMSGWNQPSGLLKSGFEFYRVYGFKKYETNFCIKVGSKNWSNLAKYSSKEELQNAWGGLMNNDPKALEG